MPHWSCGNRRALLEIYPSKKGYHAKFIDPRSDRERQVDAVVRDWMGLTSQYSPPTFKLWVKQGFVPDHAVRRIHLWWQRHGGKPASDARS